jgi:heme exporter protein B
MAGRIRQTFRAVLLRDLRLAVRRAGETLTVLAFFFLIAALFPLGIGPAPQTLAAVAAGVVWVGALLAVLLSLDRLFAIDHEDGTLDGLLLAPAPLLVVVGAKCLAHWLTTGLPLVLAAPVIALMLAMPVKALPVLLLALALATPALTLLGALGAALALGARRGGVLIPLVMLPLCVPVLIFGTMAVDAATTLQSPRPHLLLLGASLLFVLATAPPATVAALRAAAE